MTDLAAKVLQLSPEQHEMLGHAIALAHAMHASIGGKGLGVAVGELHDALSHVDIFVQPGHGGKGWGPSNCCFPRARAAAQLCYAKQRADHRRHTRRSHWQRRPWWFLPAQSLQPCTENAANAQGDTPPLPWPPPRGNRCTAGLGKRRQGSATAYLGRGLAAALRPG